MNDIKSIRPANQPAQQAIQQPVGQQPTPQYQTQQRPTFPPQVDQYGNPVQPINQDENDLPF